MNKMKIKEAEIHVTDECPHDCIFCSVKKHPESTPSIKKIKKNIRLSKPFKKLIISGGEPLLRKDIVEIIRFAKEKQKYIILETNFIMLNNNLLNKIIDSGLNEIKISFHSHNRLKYQKITKSKNFDKLINNMNLLKKYKKKIKVSTNTVITKYNHLHLYDITKFLNKNYPFIKEMRISYPRFYPIKGRNNYSKPYLVPLQELRLLLKKVKGKDVIFENIPLCILNDKRAEKVNWDIKLIKNGKIFNDLEGRYFQKKCESCKKKEKCQGLHKHYFLYFDDGFVKPFK